MSGFKPGDVVCCVDDSPCRCCGAPLPVSKGGVYRVAELQGPAHNHVLGSWITALVLRGVPVAQTMPHTGWGVNSARFRHLPKADPAFTEAMRALRPEKEGVA
jgi:hypothetical protein